MKNTLLYTKCTTLTISRYLSLVAPIASSINFFMLMENTHACWVHASGTDGHYLFRTKWGETGKHYSSCQAKVLLFILGVKLYDAWCYIKEAASALWPVPCQLNQHLQYCAPLAFVGLKKRIIHGNSICLSIHS